MADGARQRRDIVAIGASAGGVPILLALAEALPKGFPASLLVVQHIGAHPSTLPELMHAAGPTQRKLAAEQREMLLSELNHRVKSTLAKVQSIALQTLSHASDIPGFREVFFARLQSLSNTHHLLAERGWRGADLAELVHSELAAYPARAEIQGASVRLPAWPCTN